MEQLCQIYIPAGANNTLPQRAFYNTGLNGRYRAQVVGLTFTDDTANGDHRFIKLESSCFRLPYGSFKNAIVFGNKGDHAQGHPGGSYPFEIEIMGGGIDLQMVSSVAYDGGNNNKFYFCVLSLMVKPL